MSLVQKYPFVNPARSLLTLLLCAGLTPVAQALDLSDALSRAERYDATQSTALAKYMAAEEAYPQSRAAMLPDITANAFIQKDNTKRTNSTGGVIGDVTSNYQSKGYGIKLNQILFNKTLWDAMDQSKALVAKAAADYEVTKQDLIIRVATAYFNVLGAQDSLAFSRAEKDAIGRQLEQSKERFNVGLIAITDVQESQASYDTAVANVIVAENDLTNNIEALRVLIGNEVSNLATLEEDVPLLAPDPENINEWQTRALQQNIALKASKYALDAAREAYNSSKGGHYPTLSLYAEHNYNSADGSAYGSTFGGSDTTDDSIGLLLSVPIYEGGGTSSKVRQNASLVSAAQSTVDLQTRATIQEVRTAYLGVIASISSVKAFKQALVSAKTSVEATEAGFEAGTRTSVDVLLVQGKQYESERNYSRARYNYLLNLLELQRAAGSLTRDDVNQINDWLNSKAKP
jgi:outer membrane protein